MRNSISISLPDGILKQLKSVTKKENATVSEIVREALREYFFKTEFARLRRKAMIEVVKKKIQLTDEEVFKQIS